MTLQTIINNYLKAFVDTNSSNNSTLAVSVPGSYLTEEKWQFYVNAKKHEIVTPNTNIIKFKVTSFVLASSDIYTIMNEHLQYIMLTHNTTTNQWIGHISAEVVSSYNSDEREIRYMCSLVSIDKSIYNEEFEDEWKRLTHADN